MKKLFLTMCVALVSVVASAQQGEKAVGVNLSYGTEISNLGIGIKGQYGLTDAIRLEAGFDYFLKKDDATFWNINLNAHYLFPLAEKIKVYPLAGLTYAHVSTSYDADADYEKYVQYCKEWGQPIESKEEYFADGEYGDGGSDSKIGVNLGAGIQYDLNSKWAVNFEVKYQLISDFNQAVVGLGVAYKF